MDGNEKIRVINKSRGSVVVSLASRSFRREWPTKNAVVLVPYEVLEEAIYDPGFMNMIRQGILKIDNLQACKDLGLEPENAVAPVNYKIFETDELKALLITGTISQFESALQNMADTQKKEIGDLAIELQVRDGAKMDLIQKYCGVNVDQGIRLAREMER